MKKNLLSLWEYVWFLYLYWYLCFASLSSFFRIIISFSVSLIFLKCNSDIISYYLFQGKLYVVKAKMYKSKNLFSFDLADLNAEIFSWRSLNHCLIACFFSVSSLIHSSAVRSSSRTTSRALLKFWTSPLWVLLQKDTF